MPKSIRLISILASLALLAISGCAPNGDGQQSPSSDSTYVFTDGVGRQVLLPTDIERVAPSGPLAQLVLFAICPDKLVGLASMFSDEQFNYIDQKYSSLPVLGNFYGKTLNLEAVMAAAPQVIIDIGDVKGTAASDLDGIQTKTGIPTIFIPMDIDSMTTAYQTLGQVTGEATQAAALIDYISTTLSDVHKKVATIADSERLRVYYGQDRGLTAAANGTTHSNVITLAGGVNVADISAASGAGTAPISMEQLMVWQPDVILLAPNTVYNSVGADPKWQGLTAIKAGKYYEIPNGPYNWIDAPPSVNQVLGVVWLANLMYPTLFYDDMVASTQAFYQLFYHCSVTDAQVHTLLANSTYR